MLNKNKLFHFGAALLVAKTLALSFPLPAAAAPLLAMGEHTNLFFNGSATARWDDNIFLAPTSEESDLIFIFAPGLELNVGNRGNANLNLYYRQDFYVYSDNSQLDDNYANVFLESFWNLPRLNLRFDASFQQLAQVTPDLRAFGLPDQLIDRDHYRANLRGEYDITEKTSVASGIDYTKVDYKTRGFVDRDTVAIPVNFYYELTPKVDVSVGYRFRYTDTADRPTSVSGFVDTVPVPNYRDHFFNVGARGELAPKLIGEARVGYQIRDVQGAESDRSQLAFGLDFSHFTTPKTTLLAGVFRDFETGGRGSGISRTGGSLGVRHAFSHLISAQAGVNYYERSWVSAPDVQGREDETLDLNVGVTYSPTMYVDLSAGYIFRTNNSNVPQFEFDNNIFTLSAAVRF